MRFRLVIAASVLSAAFGGAADAAQSTGDISRLVPTILASDFTEVSPFGMSDQSPLGHLQASGYSVATALPLAMSAPFLPSSPSVRSLENLLVDAQVMPGWDLNLGYNALLAGRFGAYSADADGALGGLFVSAVATDVPYAALSDGGSYIGSIISVADDVRVRFGQSVLAPEGSQYQLPLFSYFGELPGGRSADELRRADTSMAGLDWAFASWGGLGMVASQTNEHNGLLGNASTLAIAKSANTSAVGVSARVGFGDGWVTTLSYNEGVTQVDLKSTEFSGSDTLRSRAYGFAIAKHGLFGDEDSLGLAVSRPLQIYTGNVGFDAAESLAAGNASLKWGGEYAPAGSATPETDLELGYVTTFMDGALSLQANAGYQMNVAGVVGQNSLSVISRAKINF